jgi:endonuclease YncB( thermonuclease family)
MLKTVFCLLFSILATTVSADTYTGRVVGISDGDTITVLDADYHQHKVRLIGIDAPEKKQQYGQVSKQHLSATVFQRAVTVDVSKLDRYKRELGKVLVGDVDVNLEQVRAGLAWHYKQYVHEQHPADRERYTEAERQAREARRGLWQDEAPTPPWEFRHAKKPLKLQLGGMQKNESTRANALLTELALGE